TDHDGIEPATATRTSRRCAELLAELARSLAERLVHLGRKRTGAHARRVRLHHADHRGDGRWRYADADRCTARRRAARRVVRLCGTARAARGGPRFGRVGVGSQQLVIRQHAMRAIADVETAFNVDALLDQAVEFLKRLIGIEHDAVADGAAHALVQDTTRDL